MDDYKTMAWYARLPKVAREKIETLEHKLAYSEAAFYKAVGASVDFPSANIHLIAPGSDYDWQPTYADKARLYNSPSTDDYIELARRDGHFEIRSGWRPLIIKPRVTNVVAIKTEDF